MQVEVDARDEGKKQGSDEGCEDSELGGGSEKQRLGVGDQRSEVRHGADTHEYQDREESALDSGVEEDLDESHGALGACFKRRIGGCDVCERNVRKHASHSDGDEKKRLEAFLDGKIEKQETHEDHHGVAPSETGCGIESEKSVESRGLPKVK